MNIFFRCPPAFFISLTRISPPPRREGWASRQCSLTVSPMPRSSYHPSLATLFTRRQSFASMALRYSKKLHMIAIHHIQSHGSLGTQLLLCTMTAWQANSYYVPSSVSSASSDQISHVYCTASFLPFSPGGWLKDIHHYVVLSTRSQTWLNQ